MENQDYNISRKEEIHSKGFDMSRPADYRTSIPSEYKSIKVGVKKLEDAVLDLGSLKNYLKGRSYVSKKDVLKALANNDIKEMRNISNFFYNVSGIY